MTKTMSVHKIQPADEWRQTHTLEEAVDNAPPGQDTSLREPSLYLRKSQ